MKKSILTTVFCLTVFLLSAQDYLITFSGTGESTTVSSVIVENITQSKSLTLNGNDVLHLKSTVTKIEDLEYTRTKGVQFYPNPMKDFSVMEFVMPEEGIAIVELFDISGRKLTQTQNYLNQGRHSYRISGIVNGIYVVNVNVGNYLYSGKLISDNGTGEIVAVTYQNTVPLNNDKEDTKSAQSEILMQYSTGDVIKFTATSGENKSVKVEVITQSKNIEIPFYKCTDKDNKNYATVKIGSQFWMAENLAYLPTVYPSSNGSNTEPRYYVYDYQGSDAAAAKQRANYSTYGVLYNWLAAKAACPPGWHLPTNAEWTALENYLIANGFNYDGTPTGDKIAISLAATTNWNTYSGTGTIGNNLSLNNKSGFSALPGGSRYYNGYFFEIDYYGYWWSSTESSTNSAWFRSLYCGSYNVYRHYIDKGYGFSVRCVRD